MKKHFDSIEKNGLAAFKTKVKFNQKISVFVGVHLWTILFCLAANAQTLAPGAPGKDAQWASAGKQAIGTSASLESKVWFTLEDGAMTEVYYPNVTVANVHKLEFVVVNPKTKKVETETADATHEIKPTRPDSLTFQQINTAKSGEWKITKTYTTDVERDSVLIDVKFEPKNKSLSLYFYYDPSLGNTGMHDYAKFSFASDDPNGFFSAMQTTPNIASALAFSSRLSEQTNGFYQTSDGLEQLKLSGKIVSRYDSASDGNVVQMARINNPSKFTTVISFADNPSKAWANSNISLAKGFTESQSEYEKGWSNYVKTLPKVEAKYQAQFNMAAMVLKAQEDKTVRGANVASLTIPWGGGATANEDVGGGYHLVWSRDLYQVVTAYMALGDAAAANRALDFLFNVQQKPDGSFPQNSQLDGTKGWGSLQLDEVAYPLIMAYQLKRFDKKTYENHVKKAADFLVKTGPKTPQERWEEKPGYSPSTIAAEIAGLVCAAEIARKNNDENSANLYLKTADDWQSNIEKWTATTNGRYGDGNYYIRLTENGKPDAKEPTVLNNGAGTFIENEIVDAGFLELVRLGIKSPDDPLIVKSLKVIDEQIKVNTPNGEAFYRYNHDGYGEMDDGRRWNFDGKYTGKGRLWALLAGERGQYELALSDSYRNDTKIESKIMRGELAFPLKVKAMSRLEAMANFANEGLMIPEQVWDKAETPKNIDKQFIPELRFGEGTGSATPLAWSMAQFIRLAVNLQAGRNLDTPNIVYDRYVLGKKESSNSKPYLASGKCNVDLGEIYSNDKKFIKYARGSNSSIAFVCEGETNEVYVFYEGKANKVETVGDFTDWKSSGYELREIATDQWLIALHFAPTTRVEYKFIVDGKWITDPLNPNQVDNGVGGENSFFAMPEYKPTTWDADDKLSVEPTDPKKVVDVSVAPVTQEIEVNSKQYGKRAIKVYLPNGYESAEKNSAVPVLYLQDGSDYINRAKAIQTQVNLAKAGKIKPFIMVFVDYKDRLKEYWAADDYAKFLATEVVPAIDTKYKTVKTRDGRAILGASLGGVTSVHAAVKYPEVFGRVGGQSSSFWIDDERVIKELETLDAAKNKYKFYFDVGTLEGADDDQKAVGVLRRKGYDVIYREGETGHNWTSWRDRLADAFVALWR